MCIGVLGRDDDDSDDDDDNQDYNNDDNNNDDDNDDDDSDNDDDDDDNQDNNDDNDDDNGNDDDDDKDKDNDNFLCVLVPKANYRDTKSYSNLEESETDVVNELNEISSEKDIFREPRKQKSKLNIPQLIWHMHLA